MADLVPHAGELTADQIVAALAARVEKAGRGTLLVVDQLEELVTMAAQNRIWTADLLARFAEPMTPGVRALVTARRDLLDPLLALGHLGHVLQQGFLLVAPMTRATWGEVIDHAFAAYEYTFEDDSLRNELLGELNDADAAMPLIQFALTELWAHRDKGSKKITRVALQAIGGIAGALEKHAESTWETLAKGGLPAWAAAQELLVSLTTPQGTRAVRPIDEHASSAQARAVIEHFEAARLLVRQEGGLTLAHEALLTQWPRLRGWLAEAREDRLLAEEVEREAARWAQDKDPSLLWKKRRLAAAQDLARRAGVKLSHPALDFIKQGGVVEMRGKVTIAIGAILIASIAGGGVLKYVNDMRVARKAAEGKERQALEQKAIADKQKAVADEERGKAETERRNAAVLRDQFKQDLDVLSDRVSKAKTLAELNAIQKSIQEKRDGAKPAEPTPQPAGPPPQPTIPKAVTDPFEE